MANHGYPDQAVDVNMAMRGRSAAEFDDYAIVNRSGTNNFTEENKKRLISKFLDATRCDDYELAEDILQSSQLNLTKAVESYNEMRRTDGVSASSSATNGPHHKSEYSVSASSPSGLDSRSSDSKKIQRGFSRVDDINPSINSRHSDSRQPNSRLLPEPKGTVNRPKSGSANSSVTLDLPHDAEFSFLLPNLARGPAPTDRDFSPEFSNYMEHQLIDFVTLNMLERERYINWWVEDAGAQATKLWPLITMGDGNCLLHAASYAMWGRQDRTLQLRGALKQRMHKEKVDGPLYRRWRWKQTQSNMEVELVQPEDDWQKDWQRLIQETTEQTNEHDVFESLEEFHVYVLANILRRPILIYSDKVIRDVEGFPLAPVPFGGIYLPLDCKPDECYKSPLVLCYDRCHFSAVTPMMSPHRPSVCALSKSQLKAGVIWTGYVPLVGNERGLLPIHYYVDPGSQVNWEKIPEDKSNSREVLNQIESYLNVKNLSVSQLNLTENEKNQTGAGSKKSGEKTIAVKLKLSVQKIKPQDKGSAKITMGPEHSDTEPDLDPEIMCAQINIKPVKGYVADVETLFKTFRMEYEDKKSRGKLKDPRSLPAIARKDYKQIMSQQLKEQKSPSQSRKNEDMSRSTFYDTAPSYPPPAYEDLEADGQPLSFRGKVPDAPSSTPVSAPSHSPRDGPSDRVGVNIKESSSDCRSCHSMHGTPEQNGYCSRCYKDRRGPLRVPDRQVDQHIIPINHIKDPQDEIDEIKQHVLSSQLERTRPFPNSDISQTRRQGNDSLILAYDRPNPAGYLTRDQPPSSLSLGIDQPHSSGLHITTGGGVEPQYRSSHYAYSLTRNDACRMCNQRPRENRLQYCANCLAANFAPKDSGSDSGLSCQMCSSRRKMENSRYCRSCNIEISRPRQQRILKCSVKACQNAMQNQRGMCNACLQHSILLQRSAKRTTGTYNPSW